MTAEADAVEGRPWQLLSLSVADSGGTDSGSVSISDDFPVLFVRVSPCLCRLTGHRDSLLLFHLCLSFISLPRSAGLPRHVFLQSLPPDTSMPVTARTCSLEIKLIERLLSCASESGRVVVLGKECRRGAVHQQEIIVVGQTRAATLARSW